MNKGNVWLVSRALAALGLVFWIYYVLKYILGVPLFLNTSGENQLALQIGFGVYGYVLLLIGVALGAFYQEAKAAKASGVQQVQIGRLMKRALGNTDFWLGIFASPVVYAVLLQAIDMTNVTPSGFVGITLVSLQNGFVCNTIAESLFKNGSPQQMTTPQS